MSAIHKKKRAVVSYLTYKWCLNNQERRYWVHPWTDGRFLRGQFVTSFGDLRRNEDKFYTYFRMTIKSFDELVSRVSPKIQLQDTNMRPAITPLEMVAATLRYLGSGCDQVDLHLEYRIGRSTLCYIIRRVCSAIWDTLKEECFAEPTEETWLAIAQGFEKNAKFPNCLGAIDGKHVRIRKPEMSGSLFHNYKNHFSIVLLAIADSNYKFIYIDVGAFGKDSDSTIFEKLQFYSKLKNNSLNIPNGKPLPGTASPTVPFIFIGDEAFSLSDDVMRPYKGKVLSETKRIFNYRLSRGRRCVESSFGILSNKWKIFQKAINVKMDLAVSVVKTCCILQNYLRAREACDIQDTYCIEGLADIPNDGSETRRAPSSSTNLRNKLADYFVSDEGSVPWQKNFIYWLQ